jgi:hypothetical protein
MIARTFMATLVLAAFAVAPTAEAQAQMLSAEGRVGVTFPTGDLSDAGAESGLGIGGELMLTFQPNLTAYVGLNRHAFSCDSDCDLGSNPRSTGLGAGLKYIFHAPGDAYAWGRGGIVAHQYADDDGSGSRNIDFELGAGIDMPVAPRIHLVPHMGFISHDAGSGVTASYLNFGVGLHYHFH